MYDFTDNFYAVIFTRVFTRGRLAGRQFPTVCRFPTRDAALEFACRQITARDWVVNPQSDDAYYVVGTVSVEGPGIHA